MSSYLHVFPIVEGPLIDENEAIATEQGLTLKDVKHGRLPLREDFENAISSVEPYDYTFDDESGTMSLRQANAEDLYRIISSIAKRCGAQFVMTDNMALFIFQPETTLEQFATSPLFNE